MFIYAIWNELFDIVKLSIGSAKCLLYLEYRKVPMVVVCEDPKQKHAIVLAKNKRPPKYGIQTAKIV